MDSGALSALRLLIKKHGTPDHRPLAALPNITLTAATCPTQPLLHICEPALTIVVQGAQSTVLGDGVLVCGSGQYLVIPVDLPLEVQVANATAEHPFLSVSLALQPEKIAALLLEAGTATGMENIKGGAPARLAVSPATQDLLDAVLRLLGLLERPSDIAMLAASIEREVLWRLINGEQGAMVRQAGLANSRMTQIGIAIRWIRSHYADTIRVQDLANTVGMSLTSFHRHFRAVTSMTPIRYQQQIRLQAARSRLMSAAADVAAVGFAVGYDSPSQFSREYKRLFGDAPGRDGERLRQLDKQDDAA